MKPKKQRIVTSGRRFLHARKFSPCFDMKNCIMQLPILPAPAINYCCWHK